MTPEIEIDALARTLYEQYRKDNPDTAAWDDFSERSKDGVRAQARFVLTERRRAEREAFRQGATWEFDMRREQRQRNYDGRCAKREREAEHRYPLPESDAPRVPESHEHKCGGCYGAPACVCKCGAVQRGDGTWTKTQPTAVPEAIQPLRPADTYEGLWLAVDDVTRKVNELVTALNALRSSPTQEKAS